MKSARVGLLAAAMVLGTCKPPPKLSVDPAALDDLQCSKSAQARCTLLAVGGGRFVNAGISSPARSGATLAAAPRKQRAEGATTRPWKPRASGYRNRAAGVRVVVSLPQQKLYAFKNGVLVGTSRVSTGMPGHATPAGSFRILEKAFTHHSNRYSNAPMPYMQRLTNYGIAIHAGRLPGYPASHGCIRLPRSFARTLYGLTDGTTVVTVTRARPKSAAKAYYSS